MTVRYVHCCEVYDCIIGVFGILLWSFYTGLVVYCEYLVFQWRFSVIGVCTVITSCVPYRYRTVGILAEEEYSLLC